MINTDVASFQENISAMLEQTIKYSEPVNIVTKDGNVVLISEEDYNDILETLYISSIPTLKARILEGMATPVSDCIPGDEVEW